VLSKEFCLLGYNAVHSVEIHPTIRRNISPPFCFMMDLAKYIFDPEDGGDMFLPNVGKISTDYTALCPRRQRFS
jgi:hypothetical protein